MQQQVGNTVAAFLPSAPYATDAAERLAFADWIDRWSNAESAEIVHRLPIQFCELQSFVRACRSSVLTELGFG
jgi:hypothetical protein